MNTILEIIAFDIASCAIIEQSGGSRIELCANPLEGGTTVSAGMMKAARAAVQIPIFPIIRPRGGDFCYSADEFAIMQHDVLLAKNTGMDGVVIGILTREGQVAVDETRKLVELAYPMEVTFHRAFDHTANPSEALEQIIDSGCQRILTSGGAPTALDGLSDLLSCIKQANDRIIILPGAGIRSTNIHRLQELTGLMEFHSSARKKTGGSSLYKSPALEADFQTFTVDADEVKACRAAVK